MKICLVGPGLIDIPPPGWGALESDIWNKYICLKNHNYDVHIVNEKDINKTYQTIEALNPDIVHLHYGSHYEILPHIYRRKIITNYDGSFVNSWKFHENIMRQCMYDCEFFILTTWEKQLLEKIGFSNKNIHIVPSGVDYDKFNRLDKPKYTKSICLGKIDTRKNQQKLQKLNCDIVFVGENNDSMFNSMDNNYLGSWNRSQVFNNLTEYTNLVLLSNAELQPLVCLEAMSAGLGLVISEACCQSLDTNLDFITVIPNDKLNNDEYIRNAIIENKNLCLSIDRNKITSYAKTFQWSNIIQTYISYL